MQGLGGAGPTGIYRAGWSEQLWLLSVPSPGALPLRVPATAANLGEKAAFEFRPKPDSPASPVWVWVPRDSPGTGAQSLRLPPDWKDNRALSPSPLRMHLRTLVFYFSTAPPLSLGMLFSFLLVVEFPLSQPSCGSGWCPFRLLVVFLKWLFEAANSLMNQAIMFDLLTARMLPKDMQIRKPDSGQSSTRSSGQRVILNMSLLPVVDRCWTPNVS